MNLEKNLNNFVARGHAAQAAADQAVKTHNRKEKYRDISIPDLRAGAAHGSVHKKFAPAHSHPEETKSGALGQTRPTLPYRAVHFGNEPVSLIWISGFYGFGRIQV